MKIFTQIILSCLLVCYCPNIISKQLSISKDESERRELMLGDLDFIKKTFATNYAPHEWKKELNGWTLLRQIDIAKRQVKNAKAISTKDFQLILKKFFNSTKDYHVSISFHSTESATLPFLVQSSQGRYFFSHIKNDVDFPFSVGDELLAIDDIPIDQYVTELKTKEVGNNVRETDQGLAELFLTARSGILGHVVPKGVVGILGHKKNSNEDIDVEISWDYKDEMIKDLSQLNQRKGPQYKSFASIQKKLLKHHDFFKKNMIIPHYEIVSKIKNDDQNPTTLLGAYKSFVPELGKIRWKSRKDSSFYAYLFELPNKKIGAYLRIPHYKERFDDDAEEFTKLIARFQKHSDILVIDQVNNPGGLVLYLYALLSTLSTEPLEPPKHRLMITQEEVAFALMEIPQLEKMTTDDEAQEEIGQTLHGIPVTLEVAQSLLKYCQFIVNEWNNGHLFTDPTYLYGMGPIEPHASINYTKPILVLVNSMDFSGGDFFPAILQDNQRATIFGTRTAGAGGYLASAKFVNLNGIARFQYTASIARRPSGIPLENHGVTPDVFYEPSVNDLQNNYVDYVQKVLKTLESILYQ